MVSPRQKCPQCRVRVKRANRLSSLPKRWRCPRCFKVWWEGNLTGMLEPVIDGELAYAPKRRRMEVFDEATVERRPGGIVYLALENKGVDYTVSIIKALLLPFPDGAKVRITVKEVKADD